MDPFKQRIEIGPWFKTGKSLSPEEVLSGISSCECTLPYCIYIHVPFCPKRCKYCALYTFEVNKRQAEVLDEYLEKVIKAIRRHPWAGLTKVPTTVHFGGGTPIFLGRDRLRLMIRILKENFGDSEDCEWALETTTSSISPGSIRDLKDLGFSRIHLGIQALNEKIRSEIKRHDSGEKAISKIDLLLEKGFKLSVDLIIGFEGQTEKMLIRDLEKLYASGIRVFSVCELRQLKVSTGVSCDHNKEESRNFKMWRRLWDFMRERGLVPIHLGQFGKDIRDNLYYTHPAREENCLSFGPYAHGSCENMVYANKLLPDYYTALDSKGSPYAYGVFYSVKHATILKLERQMLAHGISEKTKEEVRSYYNKNFIDIWEGWIDKKLLLKNPMNSLFTPSVNGSWYLGNMIQQVRKMAESDEEFF